MIRLNCDYLEGCHPAILQALAATNMEQTPGYGLDEHCEHASQMIREVFSCADAAVHFLVGGTQANTTVIAAALRPYEGVLCADSGHINQHETGAIESSGHKVLALPSMEGKITAKQVTEAVALQGDDEHVVRPAMVYISMSTEVGTLYSLDELKELYQACCALDLLLYVDGARLGYALTSPENNVTPADLATNCHVFTVGGTKVGALFGEAVVIADAALNTRFRYMIKQRGGMLAKGRLLGIQFETLMRDNLYFAIAEKAVAQALRIRAALEEKGIPFACPSPTNQQFPVLTNAQAEQLSREFVLEKQGHVDDDHVVVRVCTSWATTDEMTDAFIRAVKTL